MADEYDQAPPLIPPSAERVMLRAFCLSAVVCRSFIDEGPDDPTCRSVYARIDPWLETVRARPELESWEATALVTPLGQLDMTARIKGTWLSEGLAVLAWALGRYDLPPYDVAVDPKAVTDELEFLQTSAASLAKTLALRSAEELSFGAERAFALHWRLRNFGLNGQAMNFEDFARTAWFGPLRIDGVALANNDLSIKGVPIVDTPSDQIQLATGIAMERHRAFNWLLGYDEIYSEVDTST
jgi:hypothetical protein